jgi:hypothetical protein
MDMLVNLILQREREREREREVKFAGLLKQCPHNFLRP